MYLVLGALSLVLCVSGMPSCDSCISWIVLSEPRDAQNKAQSTKYQEQNSSPSNHRHQPPDFSIHTFFPSIRKEQIGATHRADRSRVNSLAFNTNRHQLVFVRSQQIDQSVTFCSRRK